MNALARAKNLIHQKSRKDVMLSLTLASSTANSPSRENPGSEILWQLKYIWHVLGSAQALQTPATTSRFTAAVVGMIEFWMYLNGSCL